LRKYSSKAARDNPDMRAALAAVEQAGHEVTGARAGYLPSLSLDYFYGIDAARFATKNRRLDKSRFFRFGHIEPSLVELGSHAKPGEASGASSHASTARTFAGSAQARRRNSFSLREAETSSMELGGLSRSAELAAESLKLITLRYKNGESTVLEVVDAKPLMHKRIPPIRTERSVIASL